MIFQKTHNATLARQLVRWYECHHRRLPWRLTRDPYKIWVSEIMLQQTTVATVIPYYERWVRVFPTVRDVAQAPLDRILKYWQGLGYYSRARNLHQAAKVIVRDHGGCLPQDPESLRHLPGFGPYTTGAVLSIAFDKPCPIIDANVRRVMVRLLAIHSIKDSDLEKRIYEHLLGLVGYERPSIFNQALMELGALVCQSDGPNCPSCPWVVSCRAYRRGIQDRIPRKQKKTVERIKAVVAVIRCHGAIFMQKRPPGGLLAGFWELPGGKIEKHETPRHALARELKEELGVEVVEARHAATIRHSYTRFSVQLSAWECSVDPLPKEDKLHRWVAFKEFAKYPMPAGTVKVFQRVGGGLRTESKIFSKKT